MTDKDTAKEIARSFGSIAQKEWNKDDGQELKDFFTYARSVDEDDRFVAGRIFATVWTRIYLALIQAQTPITPEDATELFGLILRDPELKNDDGSMVEYSHIWSPILATDPEAWMFFKRMEIDLAVQSKAEKSTTKTSKRQVDTEKVLRLEIRRAFLKTGRMSATMYERLEFTFFNELKALITTLTEKGIPTTVDHLQKLIEEEVTNLKGQKDLLTMVRKFKASLESIVPQEISVDVEPVVDKKAAKKKALKRVAAYEKKIAQAKKKAPAQKVAAKEKAPAVKTIEFKRTVIEGDQIHPLIQKMELSLPGLIKVVEVIDYQEDYDEVYKSRLKDLLFQLLVQYRDQGLKFGLLHEVVWDLQLFLERQLQKMPPDHTKRTKKQKKFSIMIGPVGTLEHKISEMMPSTFKEHDTCTFRED